MVFVRRVVPPDATLVIPREEQHYLYGHEGMMEFFFFPRQVINCPTSQPSEVEACIRSLRGDTTYFLRVEGFPPEEAAETSKIYIGLDDTHGVYVPRPDEP